jgi:hypothetical protein
MVMSRAGLCTATAAAMILQMLFRQEHLKGCSRQKREEIKCTLNLSGYGERLPL